MFTFLWFMENAGSADAFLQSLHSPEWNVEHGLALLTKALSKAMKGRQAHRVYHAAKQAGLVTNYQSYGLPGLTMACVDSGMLQQALGVSEDARQALLPLGMTTASALLTNVAKAKSAAPQLLSILAEVSARRMTCDANSLLAAYNCLMGQAPPALDEAIRALNLTAAASKPPPVTQEEEKGSGKGGKKKQQATESGGGEYDAAAAKAVRAKLPSLLHSLMSMIAAAALVVHQKIIIF